MKYWLEDVSKCPEDRRALKEQTRIIKIGPNKSIRVIEYVCPICRNEYLKYEGAEIAAQKNTSPHFLPKSERDLIKEMRKTGIEIDAQKRREAIATQKEYEKIKAREKQLQLQKQQEALAAKREQERLEKKRLEEQKRKEEEARKAAEEERKRRMLEEFTTDELFISDRTLYTRAEKILKEIYGQDAKFHAGQYEAIERTLKEKRLLVVQRTGWGKSLVYYICTKLLREDGAGVTFVISPLLALMDNQLVAARKMGMKCAALNSKTYEERAAILDGVEANEYDLILVTPESLRSRSIQERLPNIKIGLLVIDEAHCISDWGHDFRLEYNQIYKFVKTLPDNAPILATTATANNAVIEDLAQQMGEPNVSRGHLMRDNLSIQVLKIQDKANRYAWILDNINNLQGTGIIYCLSRKDCEWLADFLSINGINAKPYYSGGKEQEARNQVVLQQFLDDKIKVIVSTVKLGMGFDKDNVAFVIHFQCPKNVIAYYQQIGRAGRHIPFARTYLMLGEEDYKINKSFIEKAFPTQEEMYAVWNYVRNNNYYCTINKICAAIDLPKKTVSKCLDFLVDGEMLTNEWHTVKGNFYQTYKPTMNPFVYRGEHYERIKATRYRELEQMQKIANTNECISRVVVSALDDVVDHDCHHCENCDPDIKLPILVKKRSLEKAKNYLENLVIPIEPWNYWPRNSLVDQINNYPNLTGIALAKYNEGKYGKLVKEGKYVTKRFDDQLVRKGATVLKPYIQDYDMHYITAVPSQNSGVVPDYAKRLAKACGLKYIELLNKTNNKHQKDLKNRAHQFVNAYQSFELKPDVEVPEGVILVDDMVDSGLTLAVCGYILRLNDCSKVFPLALADSGSGREDDDDDE